MQYSERHKLFAGKIVISYPLTWGGQFADRWMWMGELNGEVWDYDTRDHLIQKAIAEGFDYVVLRVHKDGSTTQLGVHPCNRVDALVMHHFTERGSNESY